MFSLITKRLGKPFNDLTHYQHTLLIARLGFSFLAVLFAIIFLILRQYPQQGYWAKIVCSHLDLSQGLYNSIQNLLEDLVSVDELKLLLKRGQVSSVSNSDITLLSEYAETKIANAPQYILMGVLEWCSTHFQWNSTDVLGPPINKSTTCYSYGEGNLFDYQRVLNSTDLLIVLAYAYESSVYTDQSYKNYLANQLYKNRTMTILFMLLFATQVVAFLATFIVYSNRRFAKLLTETRDFTFHIVAIFATVSGICLLAAFGTSVVEFLRSKRSISLKLGSFGILLSPGHDYYGVFLTSTVCSILCMLAWTIPLWCANPPDDSITDHSYSRAGKLLGSDRRASLDTISMKSLLFDETQITASDEYFEQEKPPANKKIDSESELRKLGKKMAMGVSVRKSQRPGLLGREASEVGIEEAQKILYGGESLSYTKYPRDLTRAGTLSSMNTLLDEKRERSSTSDFKTQS